LTQQCQIVVAHSFFGFYVFFADRLFCQL
jgi:hypothetical protein